MKSYEIYENNSHQYQAVKEGWSWPAFFFTFFWAFYKGLWLYGIGGVLLWGLLAYGNSGLESEIMTIVAIISYPILWGALGNESFTKNIIKKGFALRKTISANSTEEAIAIYLREHTSKLSRSHQNNDNADFDREDIIVGKQDLSQLMKKNNESSNLSKNKFSSSVDDTKTCQICGEKIKKIAIKCRYCHSDIKDNKPIREETKGCPYCGEDILKSAIKCNYCESNL